MDQVLGHKDGKVGAVFDRFAYFDEKCRALDGWSRELRRILKGEGEGSKVIPLYGLGAMQVGLLILFDGFKRIQNLPLDLHIFRTAPCVSPVRQRLHMADRTRPTLDQLCRRQVNLFYH